MRHVLADLAVAAGIELGLGSLRRIHARYPVQLARQHIGTGVFLRPRGEGIGVRLDLVHRGHVIGQGDLVFGDGGSDLLDGLVIGVLGFRIVADDIVLIVGEQGIFAVVIGVVRYNNHGFDVLFRERFENLDTVLFKGF